MGTAGIRDAYLTGRGSIRVRSKVRIEENNRGGQRIVVTELPYQVSGDRLLVRIRDLVREGRLNGIVDIANESNKEGTRLVIECRRDAVPQVVLNQLYKHTQLQDSFGVIMLALVDGVPGCSTWPTCCRTTSPTRSPSSSAGPATSCARPRSGPTSSRACWSPSTTWTRSSTSSATPSRPTSPGPS